MEPSFLTSSKGLLWGVWTKMRPYAKEPIAAGSAIIPVFYGFIAKSARQLGKPLPKMMPIEALKQGIKVSPTIGTIVGMQLLTQRGVEYALSRTNCSPAFCMFISAAAVALLSVPPLAIFNGQTMGYSWKASLKSLSTKKQIATAIWIREMSFLFSIRISAPLSQRMKQISGDNQIVDYACAFSTGFIGSVIGHPADTALTLWQKNKRVIWRKNWNAKRKLACALRLMRGGLVKGVTVGAFNMSYKCIKNILES